MAFHLLHPIVTMNLYLAGVMRSNMLFYMLILFSANTFAITGFDSWPTIKTSKEVTILQPTFASAFGPGGLFNACTTDNEFKSLSPVKTCLQYTSVTRYNTENKLYKDYECSAYDIREVSMSRTYIQNVCLKHAPMNSQVSVECIEYGLVNSVYPTTFSFPVVEASSEEHGSLLFSKTFAIVSCE
jgi:hypothetical protein